ncbi:MAG: hypothetical protein ACFFFT_04755 [Candidatus Thorarchaeota archaeon]
MESSLEIDFEEKLYSYLKQNKRSTFTSRALVDRLKEIVPDPQLRKYGMKNLQKILNTLRDNGKIRATKHQNKMYYSFLDPEDPSVYRTFQDLCPIPSIEEIKRLSKSKYKRTIKMGLITGVIGVSIGVIFGALYHTELIGAVLLALIGFGIGFLLPTIFMILANLAKTKYFPLVLLLITGIIGAVIGGFIGARIGEVALGILIGFLIGFFGPLLLGMGCGCG